MFSFLNVSVSRGPDQFSQALFSGFPQETNSVQTAFGYHGRGGKRMMPLSLCGFVQTKLNPPPNHPVSTSCDIYEFILATFCPLNDKFPVAPF